MKFARSPLAAAYATAQVLPLILRGTLIVLQVVAILVVSQASSKLHKSQAKSV